MADKIYLYKMATVGQMAGLKPVLEALASSWLHVSRAVDREASVSQEGYLMLRRKAVAGRVNVRGEEDARRYGDGAIMNLLRLVGGSHLSEANKGLVKALFYGVRFMSAVPPADPKDPRGVWRMLYRPYLRARPGEEAQVVADSGAYISLEVELSGQPVGLEVHLRAVVGSKPVDAIPVKQKEGLARLPNNEEVLAVWYVPDLEGENYAPYYGRMAQSPADMQRFLRGEVKNFLVPAAGESKVLEQKADGCFCNRNFTEEELRRLVVDLRKSTTDQEKKTIFPVHKERIFYLGVEGLPVSEQNNFEEFARVLNATFSKFNINTCLRKIHFLAQSYPETGFFTRLKEKGINLKYDPYRGRGLIQLTGVRSPKNSSKWIEGVEDSRTGNATSYLGYMKYSKIDVVNNPDLISDSLYLSADSAGWFWEHGKLLENGSTLNLNNVADKDNIDEVSKKVNGGNEALRQRREAYLFLKKIFDYDNCVNKK